MIRYTYMTPSNLSKLHYQMSPILYNYLWRTTENLLNNLKTKWGKIKWVQILSLPESVGEYVFRIFSRRFAQSNETARKINMSTKTEAKHSMGKTESLELNLWTKPKAQVSHAIRFWFQRYKHLLYPIVLLRVVYHLYNGIKTLGWNFYNRYRDTKCPKLPIILLICLHITW